jgi:tetratricopeptide (TPR) repeat protein
LSEPERALLRRLAVFAGGWTLSAAEAVGAGDEVETSNVLDLLTRLVEKSLVEFDADAGRYGLLETVRHYAQERLAASGEGDPSRTRHLAFYMALADNATPRLVGADQGVWLSWLDLEHENLLSTHNWCEHAEGGAALGLRLVLAMQPYWLTRGMLALAYRATVESLTRGMTEDHARDRCRVVLSAGQLAYFMGRYEEAVQYGEDGLVIALSNGDKRRVAGAHAMLGTAYLAQDEQTAARGHLDEALAMARASGENHVLAIALNALAELHRTEGDLEAAENRYMEALALDRARGDRTAAAVNLVNLAHVAIVRNSGVRACQMAGEALAIAEDLGSRRIGAVGLDVSAGIAALLGKWTRAARLFGAARAQEEQTGIRRDPADEAYLTPLIARAREALGEGAFAHAEAGGRMLGYEDALSEARASVDCRS